MIKRVGASKTALNRKSSVTRIKVSARAHRKQYRCSRLLLLMFKPFRPSLGDGVQRPSGTEGAFVAPMKVEQPGIA